MPDADKYVEPVFGDAAKSASESAYEKAYDWEHDIIDDYLEEPSVDDIVKNPK